MAVLLGGEHDIKPWRADPTAVNFSKVFARVMSISMLIWPCRRFWGIQDVVVSSSVFFGGTAFKVSRMPDSGSSTFGRGCDRWINPLEVDISQDEDAVMEQILENIHNTPLGRVLKRIASLPEIRREKVLRVRQEITEGRYDLTGRLDLVLDKVLEELTA